MTLYHLLFLLLFGLFTTTQQTESKIQKQTTIDWPSFLNENVEPCTDFSTFSCGQSLDENKTGNLSEFGAEKVLKEIGECQADAILVNFHTDSHAIKQMRLYRDAYIRFRFTGAQFNWKDLELTKQERKDLTQEIQLLFPLVADHLFVRECVQEEHLMEVRKIAENVMRAFHQLLRRQSWFDPPSLGAALRKNLRTQIVIGAPSKTMDLKELDRIHAKLDFDKHNSLYEMRHKLKSAESSDDDQEAMDGVRATTLNAYNFLDENVVFLPAGILFSPNFHPKNPMTIKYGAIGSVVGHELAHNFGLTFFYDSEKIQNKLWSKWAFREYKKRAKCTMQAYGRKMVPGAELKEDDYEAVDENMADNVGVRVAYRAFQRARRQLTSLAMIRDPSTNYTADQQFFISFARHWCFISSSAPFNSSNSLDSHFPASLRINVPMKNFSKFAKTFQCPVGSTMNPRNKCSFSLWGYLLALMLAVCTLCFFSTLK